MRATVAALTLSLAACKTAPSPAPSDTPEASEQAGATRWSYEIRVDEQLERMQLGLCIDGQVPSRLIAGREALQFVTEARVRGGPPLERDDRGFSIATLGEHGCVDVEIDLDRASEHGRDSGRHGDTLMLPPDRWLWYPAAIPEQLDARARFELPEGVAVTVPWPRIDPDVPEHPEDWRALDRSAFAWNAWIALGRYQPLHFEAAGCEFEVAILDGERTATDAGIATWLQLAAESVAQLYGRFPRERIAIVVVPTRSWRSTPVLFGMVRRGGGGSVMLLLNDHVRDEALPGEWVAVHELLHLGLPLIADAWMAEGLVTYYTPVVRARRGLLDDGDLDGDPDAGQDQHERQVHAALELLRAGFDARKSAHTLATASARMRELGSYRRVYWGGAAAAFDLDVQLRSASDNRRSLDDLMLAIWPLAPEPRRFSAADLLARMDEEVARWHRAGELAVEIVPSQIAAAHLRAKVIPEDVQRLRGLAVEVHSRRLRLLANPNGELKVRRALFARKIVDLESPQ